MKYFDKDFLEIYWNEDIHCVVMVWKKFIRGEDFREGLNTGLELLIEKNASRWLADLRNLKILSNEDQEWSNNEWFPRATKAGIKKMALVKPRSALAKMGVKNIMTRVNKIQVETAYFDNAGEALKWLDRP
ncbi:MAG: STAS/SEC14 domain-containing protein [Bacteroidota bacterium]|nr:STAS/SEC14 domain-containing protein [Bacteroidota bacterium]